MTWQLEYVFEAWRLGCDGRLGVIFNERVRMCPACARSVRAAIEAQMAVER